MSDGFAAAPGHSAGELLLAGGRHGFRVRNAPASGCDFSASTPFAPVTKWKVTQDEHKCEPAFRLLSEVEFITTVRPNQ